MTATNTTATLSGSTGAGCASTVAPNRPPSRSNRWLWRLLRLPPTLLYRIGLGAIPGRTVLLLTTTGRVTGRPHTTPLQYEQIDGDFYVGSARGARADWFRNLIANPQVTLQVGDRRFIGRAEAVTDPTRIADFLEVRLQRHPRLVGAIVRRAGLPADPTFCDLEAYAAGRTLAVIQPLRRLAPRPAGGIRVEARREAEIKRQATTRGRRPWA